MPAMATAPKLPNRILVTPQEAADFLDVSLKTIYQWLKRDEFPGAAQVGCSWRIPRKSILDKFKLDN